MLLLLTHLLTGVPRCPAAVLATTAGQLAFIKNLELVGDDVMCWRFALFNFDNDLAGGKQLNADLAQLQRRWAAAGDDAAGAEGVAA